MRALLRICQSVGAVAAAALFVGNSAAQTPQFVQAPPLSFSMIAGANPVPQNLSVVSAGANFDFIPSVASGASWLQVSCSGPRYSDGYPTPSLCTVGVSAATVSAGSYTGGLTFSRGAVVMSVAVTLTVVAPGGGFLNGAPSALNFVAGNGFNAAAQTILLNNSGGGPLDWTASKTVANGNSGWLSLSAASGSTPATLRVGVSPEGLAPGIYVGQVLLQAKSGSVTIPVSLMVADSTTSSFQQLPGLNFTMLAGSNPAPQNLSIASTGASFRFLPLAQNSGSTSWLKVSCNAPRYSDGYPTPAPCRVSVEAQTLSAGFYTGVVTFTNSSLGMTVPVTLTVLAPGSPFFHSVSGGLNFVAGIGYNPAPQSIQIRNAGSGTLNWTAAASVFRSSSAAPGPWLTLSAASGSAPSILTANVSAKGLPPGVYLGQVLLQSDTSAISLPVSLVVVDNTTAAFQQMPGLDLAATAGSSPIAQNLTVASTGKSFHFAAAAENTGATNWLKVSCLAPQYSDGFPTPAPCSVTVSAATLSPGFYVGEVTFTNESYLMTVPVTLTVAAPSLPLFGGVGGGLSFSAGLGFTPGAQTIRIINAGGGDLNWTAETRMYRGAVSGEPAWLRISAGSGAAPASFEVSVTPEGLMAGLYLGQVILRAGDSTITIPISLAVVDTDSIGAFQQLPALSFTTAAGRNPLPQNVTVASTGATFHFSASAQTGSASSWLKVECNAPQYSDGFPAPAPCFVSVNSSTLAPGFYAGQVTFSNQSTQMTVPVTLTVMAPNSAFFNGVSGGLSFTSGMGFNPAPQTLQITNGGSGDLRWTAVARTHRNNIGSEAGWLSVSAPAGTAPSTLTVNVSAQGLPAGIYLGQILLQSAADSLSIPVSLVVVDTNTTSTFQQMPGLSFAMAPGANPLSQNLVVASTGESFHFEAVASSSGGAGWLKVNCNSPQYSDGFPTPAPCAVSVSASTLPPGVYAGEVTFSSHSAVVTVPVTLTVIPAGDPLFNGIPGGLNFVSGNGFSTAPQTIQVLNDGGGALNWSAAATVNRTAVGGASNWLSLSASGGMAPSTLTVSASPAGLAPGIYLAEILFQSDGSSVSIPVSLTIADASVTSFQQLTPLTFTTAVGSNPAAQTVSVASTGSAFHFIANAQNTGSTNWLKTTCTGGQYSDGYPTPSTCTITATAATLAAGAYSGQVTLSSQSGTMTVPVLLQAGSVSSGAPSITTGGIVPIASSSPVVQPGEWISVYGRNLAVSTTVWNGDFPTSLAGVSVTVDGKRAYLWYVSPGQINLQVPDGVTRGSVPVVVTTPMGSSASSVTVADYAPSFLLLDSKHVTGIIYRADGRGAFGGGTYDVIGPTGNSLGYPTVAAKPGDVIGLYGVGFGPTSVAVPAGQAFTGAAATLNPVTILINGQSVAPSFAGLSSAGLYQINLTIPEGLGTGEVPIVAKVGNTQTQDRIVISLK